MNQKLQLRNQLTLRNQRIEAHLHLVRPLAIHYAIRTGHDRDDLIQAGCLGLIRAAQRFDPGAQVPFNAYARPHIRGAILHYLRDSVGLIRLPRRVEERAQALLKQEAHGSIAGLGPACNEDDRLAKESYAQKNLWQPLDEQVIPAPNTQWNALINGEKAGRVNRALLKLMPAERQAIEQVVFRGESLRCAAARLGVSAMTVQRRLKRGLTQLSTICKDLDPGRG
ncbi:MAG: sigma-70 family RNA polymerase sigma factor [Prochlorococcus sp.]